MASVKLSRAEERGEEGGVGVGLWPPLGGAPLSACKTGT